MRIRVLGRFTVTEPGRDRTPTGVPAQALKILVCGDRSLHWEELAELLWPSVHPHQGRVRMRNVLSRLRAQSGDVVVRRGGLLLIPHEVSIDSEEFEALARKALDAAAGPDRVRLARQALEHYRGDLLPGDRYSDWSLQPRERLRRRFRGLLELLVADARERDDLESALLLLERAMGVEPDDAQLALDTVELLIELDRRAAAVRLLERVEASLELAGLPISPRWLALYRDARQDAPSR